MSPKKKQTCQKTKTQLFQLLAPNAFYVATNWKLMWEMEERTVTILFHLLVSKLPLRVLVYIGKETSNRFPDIRVLNCDTIDIWGGDKSLFWGAVQCVVRCSAASLASMHKCQEYPSPSLNNQKCLFTYSNVLGGGGVREGDKAPPSWEPIF